MYSLLFFQLAKVLDRLLKIVLCVFKVELKIVTFDGNFKVTKNVTSRNIFSFSLNFNNKFWIYYWKHVCSVDIAVGFLSNKYLGSVISWISELIFLFYFLDNAGNNEKRWAEKSWLICVRCIPWARQNRF